MSMRDQIAEHIYTHVSSMCEVFGEESAADAIIAMPEISNAQAKIAELENALAAASGTIAAMRADAAKGQARISQLEGALGSLQGWAQSKPHPAGETPREYHMHAIICEALTALKSKP